MTDTPGEVTHPQTPDPELTGRVGQVAHRVGRYWVFGPLGFLEGLSPGFAVFYPFFLLVVPAIVGDSLRPSAEPLGWVERGSEGGPTARLLAYWTRWHPVALAGAGLHTVSGVLLRGRGMAPAPDAFETETTFGLPFDGEWTVLRGSPDEEYAHSTTVPQHRYAHDFVVTDETGATFDRDGERNDSTSDTGASEARLAASHCFGEPVLAPADGTVAATSDGHPDGFAGLDPREGSLYGNHVVLDHGDEYSLLAHLQADSLTVSVGDTVERGEQLGRCGSSGRATEPQLHVQVLDRANPYAGVALPVAFADVTTDGPGAESDTVDRTYLHCGQSVRPG